MYERPTALHVTRCVLGTGFFLVFLCFSFITGGMTGWSFTETGLERLGNSLGLLAGSAMWGLIGVGGMRLIIGWKLLSPWLAVALALPVVFGLGTLGWLPS